MLTESECRDPKLTAQWLASATAAANAARTSIEAADHNLRDAEASYERLLEAARLKPTEKSIVARQVGEQLVINAKDQLADVTAAAQPALLEETRAQWACEYARCYGNFESYNCDADALVRQIVEAEGAIRAARDKLLARLVDANENGRLASSLAGSLCLESTDAHGNRQASDPWERTQTALRRKYFDPAYGKIRADSTHRWVIISEMM
jgi:hypothetical protein